jgi:hypothetical protein
MPGQSLDKEIIIPAAEWMSALKPLLDEGHELRLLQVGTSMVPFLRGGRDEVFLCSPKIKKPARGDIALFSRDDGLFVLHRIHHIKKNQYYMLGDAQTWIEGPLSEDCIQAIATAVIRKNKKLSCSHLWLKLLTKTWMILRPLRPLILCFIRGLYRIIDASGLRPAQ